MAGKKGMEGGGGKRTNAGRKPGGKNQKTVLLAKAIAEAGTTPLEYMLGIMRDEGAEKALRAEMAKAAAPYIHPKLQSIEMSGGLTLSHENALDALR